MPANGHKIDAEISRKVARLRIDDGLSIPALAERFGISEKSVKTAARRLRAERAGLGAP